MQNQTRTIAYHPEFKTITGSTTAALLLTQFWYWSKNKTEIRRNGQFFKTQKEISLETGLSRSEYETAINRLENKKIIENELKGRPRKTWIRVNLNRLLNELERIKSSLVEIVHKVIHAPSGAIKKTVKVIDMAKRLTERNDAKPMTTRVNIPDPKNQYCTDDYSQCVGLIRNFVAWIDRNSNTENKETLVRTFQHFGLNHNYVKTCFDNHVKQQQKWYEKHPNSWIATYFKEEVTLLTEKSWKETCQVTPNIINHTA